MFNYCRGKKKPPPALFFTGDGFTGDGFPKASEYHRALNIEPRCADVRQGLLTALADQQHLTGTVLTTAGFLSMRSRCRQYRLRTPVTTGACPRHTPWPTAPVLVPGASPVDRHRDERNPAPMTRGNGVRTVRPARPHTMLELCFIENATTLRVGWTRETGSGCAIVGLRLIDRECTAFYGKRPSGVPRGGGAGRSPRGCAGGDPWGGSARR